MLLLEINFILSSLIYPRGIGTERGNEGQMKREDRCYERDKGGGGRI